MDKGYHRDQKTYEVMIRNLQIISYTENNVAKSISSIVSYIGTRKNLFYGAMKLAPFFRDFSDL